MLRPWPRRARGKRMTRRVIVGPCAGLGNAGCTLWSPRPHPLGVAEPGVTAGKRLGWASPFASRSRRFHSPAPLD